MRAIACEEARRIEPERGYRSTPRPRWISSRCSTGSTSRRDGRGRDWRRARAKSRSVSGRAAEVAPAGQRPRAGIPRSSSARTDTVPPWIAPRGTAAFTAARDAKGQTVAMIAAARARRGGTSGCSSRSGRRPTARAAVANRRSSGGSLASAPRDRRQPTGLRWVRAHRGAFRRNSRDGRAGHSSQGLPSAIHALVRTSNRHSGSWGEHPCTGRGTLNLGHRGGVAANVVAASAEADILVPRRPAETVRADRPPRARRPPGDALERTGRPSSSSRRRGGSRSRSARTRRTSPQWGSRCCLARARSSTRTRITRGGSATWRKR